MSAPILIFGARGQVGRELTALAAARKVPAVGLSRNEANIADNYAVRSAIDMQRPAVVVNAAGYTAVDRAERDAEAAIAANVTGPAILAAACADAGVPLIHLSSAYIFDGLKKTPYVETDRANPLGVHGRTKTEGEAKIREATKRHVILRTSWVYGVYGRNFLRTTMRLAAERDELKMVADQFGCPNTSGTFHFAGNGRTTWLGFAEEIVRRQAIFTGRTPKVVGISTAEYPSAAKRPANCELDSSKFASTFGYRARPWQERVVEVVAQLSARVRPAEQKGDVKPAEAKAEEKPAELKAPDATPAEAKAADAKPADAAS
jgi:dTDP-4-dehydrorhamnose reductase